MGDSGFVSQTQRPQINYLTEDVPPPSDAYVTVADVIVISVRNSATGAALSLNFRLLLPDGSVSINSYAVVPATDRTVTSKTFPLTEGFILDVLVSSTGSTIRRGQCFVSVSLARGGAVNQTLAQAIIRGYVTTTDGLSWPPWSPEAAMPGRGNIRTVTPANPAAGADDIETVPAGAIWRLQSWIHKLTASAAVGTRTTFLLVDDGATILLFLPAQTTIAAGGAVSYQWAPNLPNNINSGGVVLNALPPDQFLPAGSRIRTSTAGMDAADQISLIAYQVEEWIQP